MTRGGVPRKTADAARFGAATSNEKLRPQGRTTDREPLLAVPNVALNDKSFPALADEHSKSGKFCIASKVLT